jgi:hypothetical protein
MRYCVAYMTDEADLPIGDPVGWTATAEDAKKLANERAWDTYYGTCIVDLKTGLVDYGDSTERVDHRRLDWLRRLRPNRKGGR